MKSFKKGALKKGLPGTSLEGSIRTVDTKDSTISEPVSKGAGVGTKAAGAGAVRIGALATPMGVVDAAQPTTGGLSPSTTSSAILSDTQDIVPQITALASAAATLDAMAAAAPVASAAAAATTNGWRGQKLTDVSGNAAATRGQPADAGNPGAGNGGDGNTTAAARRPDDAGNPGKGNGGDGNSNPGGNRPPDSGNPGNGNGGDGNQNPGGGGSDKPGAPTPPDELLQDPDTATYVSPTYTFKIDDISGGFDGATVATDPSIIDYDDFKTTKEGVALYAIDSEFGFYVTDFVGAQGKVRDDDHSEGWAGNLTGPNGEIIGLAVSDAPTDRFSTPARLGTWLEGIGGNTVKASTEHYSVMQAVLSDQTLPEGSEVDNVGLYPLDDDLKLVDYKLRDDDSGMPDLAPDGRLQKDDFHDFHIGQLVTAMGEADGYDESTAVVQGLDFNGDDTIDATEMFKAYMADRSVDGVTRNIAVIDFVKNAPVDGDPVDFEDSNLNGFGTFGIADFLAPNESTILEDIAYGDDYSVTLKDDGKLLYRWGNSIKRPNDIRIDAKVELPDVWTEVDADNGLKKLYLVTAAELVVNHTVTNNPNDQIRPEDFENEAAIGILPTYEILNEGTDQEQWVSTDGYYAGDGRFYPAGTVLRDASLIDDVAGSTLAAIGALSSDLSGGFTEAWYTTMDREPFQADLNDAGTEYDIGPRWRLQPDKYGQDLPSVTIPIDPSKAPPVQNGEEKYEVGADTTTVLNLLDWNGVSPLTLSAGWQSNTGTVSDNGLNMTDAFDVAFYVKGDSKPVNLYDAQLVMSYEDVDVHAKNVDITGTADTHVLVGEGGNDFYLDASNGEEDLIVFGYGAESVAEVGDNTVDGFAYGEDALGLIGFDLNPDNFSIHITQKMAGDNLVVSLDQTDIATLSGVNEFLGADDFYFA